jgi:hypothetical protein
MNGRRMRSVLLGMPVIIAGLTQAGCAQPDES